MKTSGVVGSEPYSSTPVAASRASSRNDSANRMQKSTGTQAEQINALSTRLAVMERQMTHLISDCAGKAENAALSEMDDRMVAVENSVKELGKNFIECHEHLTASLVKEFARLKQRIQIQEDNLQIKVNEMTNLSIDKEKEQLMGEISRAQGEAQDPARLLAEEPPRSAFATKFAEEMSTKESVSTASASEDPEVQKELAQMMNEACKRISVVFCDLREHTTATEKRLAALENGVRAVQQDPTEISPEQLPASLSNSIQESAKIAARELAASDKSALSTQAEFESILKTWVSAVSQYCKNPTDLKPELALPGVVQPSVATSDSLPSRGTSCRSLSVQTAHEASGRAEELSSSHGTSCKSQSVQTAHEATTVTTPRVIDSTLADKVLASAETNSETSSMRSQSVQTSTGSPSPWVTHFGFMLDTTDKSAKERRSQGTAPSRTPPPPSSRSARPNQKFPVTQPASEPSGVTSEISSLASRQGTPNRTRQVPVKLAGDAIVLASPTLTPKDTGNTYLVENRDRLIPRETSGEQNQSKLYASRSPLRGASLSLGVPSEPSAQHVLEERPTGFTQAGSMKVSPGAGYPTQPPASKNHYWERSPTRRDGSVLVPRGSIGRNPTPAAETPQRRSVPILSGSSNVPVGPAARPASLDNASNSVEPIRREASPQSQQVASNMSKLSNQSRHHSFSQVQPYRWNQDGNVGVQTPQQDARAVRVTIGRDSRPLQVTAGYPFNHVDPYSRTTMM